MNILVTGGYGYIGSHLVKELVARGHEVDVIDADYAGANYDFVQGTANLVTSKPLQECLPKMRGKHYDAIVHLAAYISVEESVNEPDKYWHNNLTSLLDVIRFLKTDHLIFASTGTAFQPESPYARTKVIGEQIICETAYTSFSGFTNFRFYNVSGLGEGLKPTGQPTHLIRLAAMAAKGIIPELKVFGSDWDTRDGTCIRDYIHVEDIAASIANAVEVGPANSDFECLGTGTGNTVLEVIQSMKRVSGVDFRVIMANRRSGDVASMVCPSQYKHISLTQTLDDMCLSAYVNV